MDVYEKNAIPGGRARQFSAEGFTFDMGPSWYWMPQVFDEFFHHFGRTSKDYYQLVKPDPAFGIYFADEKMDVPAELPELYALFERYEAGASGKLKEFLTAAGRKYEIAMRDMVHYPCHSVTEFMSLKVLRSALHLDLLTGFDRYVGRFFRNEKLKQLMEFPVLFLGGRPADIPAMYSLMNYSAFTEGTLYPMGGMYVVVEALLDLAAEMGVRIHTSAAVEKIEVQERKAQGIWVNGELVSTDVIVGSGDYHHIESQLLTPEYRNYSDKYWNNRTMAPSCLMYYLGIDRKLPAFDHHMLFFDTDFKKHADQIYDAPEWPDEPQFYVCCPSKTDPTVAPSGKENVVILIPLAAGLEERAGDRERYLPMVLDRIEQQTGERLHEHISYQRSYCLEDFVSDYHAYKGNAYGLANTLGQTAILKPKMRNRHVNNLWYIGQLTVPGPGVPPSLISGAIAAKDITKTIGTRLKKTRKAQNA